MKKVDRLRKPCKSRNLKASYLETAWWFLGWPHPMSENEAGTWQRRTFVIPPWKGSVFVGGWLPDHGSTPCLSRGFTSIQVFHTHTHPPVRVCIMYNHIYYYICIHSMKRQNQKRMLLERPRLQGTANISNYFHNLLAIKSINKRL